MQTSVKMLRSVIAIAALSLTSTAFAAGQDSQAGQTVFKDPVTGQFRNPTAAEAKKLNDLRSADRAAQKAARKAAGEGATGVVRLQQNGIVAAHVDEESIMHSVMTRNADGTLAHNCVHGKTAADTSALTVPVTMHAKEHQNEVQ